jgi:hypothetical protein
MLAVEDDERRDLHHSTWGHLLGHGNPATYVSAEIICATVSAEQGCQAARDLVRKWCGQDARDRHDELRALRTEVARLGQLVERAITAVRRAGDVREANALERDLGVLVEVVRRLSDAQRSSGP